MPKEKRKKQELDLSSALAFIETPERALEYLQLIGGVIISDNHRKLTLCIINSNYDPKSIASVDLLNGIKYTERKCRVVSASRTEAKWYEKDIKETPDASVIILPNKPI